ncbi:DNA cytosine methyltransferase, partial [Ilumatobacter sp.]|uniref:DNA cytosine methyltransferase n=1 Tax=Ilumatobacter sp. TaxID=1967498 RepID=UPI003753C3E6
MSKRQGYGVKLVRGPFVALPQHHLATDDPDVVARLASESIGPIAADLFCGAGGLSLGLERAGYKVLVGVDHDEDALATHRAHHAGMSSKLDLAEPSVVEELGALLKRIKVDLIAGGPPRQPFSRAGRSAMRDLVQRGSRP